MYFRAFFGVPEIKADNGTPVNAVRGLLDFITRLVGEYQPTHLVCCWDNDWRPQWRVDLIPSYKSHRVVAARPGDQPDIEEVPDPLEMQVPVIRAVLDAFGIAVVGADGYEADDVIGTLATGAGDAGRHRHRRPRPVPARRRRAPRCGSSTSPAASAGTSGSPRTSSGRSTPSRPPSTPTSRPCAATPPTGCPASPGVGDKTAATLLQRFGDDGRDPGGRRRPRLRPRPQPALEAPQRRRLPRRRPAGGRRRPRHRPRPRSTPRSPASRRTRSWSPRSPRSSTSAARSSRLTETLAAR